MSELQTTKHLRRVPRLLGQDYITHSLPQALTKLGRNLRQLMVDNHVSVNQLAVKTGVPVNTIKGLIKGDNFPSHKTLSRIAAGLDVNPAVLILGDNNGHRP